MTDRHQPIRGEESSDSIQPNGRNQFVGWTSLTLGAVTGLTLGLWSFDGPLPLPDGLGDYGETARRLARLGHIACFGLGILNILLARELCRFSLGQTARRIALGAMNFGNVFLPLTLFAAAVYHPLKYLMPAPALAVFAALAIAAYGAWVTRKGAGDARG